MADAVGGAQANGVNGHANGIASSYASKYNLASHFIGGNELSKAPPSKVKDFVAQHDGHTVITKVSTQSLETRRTRWSSWRKLEAELTVDGRF